MADKTQTENEPSTTPTPTPAEAEAEGGETSMDSGVVPMIGVFCASTILLTAACVPTDRIPMYGYSISVAVVTMFLSLFVIGPSLPKLKNYIKYFLFLWCFVAACILTYEGAPFSITGNGYFSLWLMSIFSFLSLESKERGINIVKDAAKKIGAPSMVGLLFFSIVIMIDVIPHARGGNATNWQAEGVYALVVALCTILMVIIFTLINCKSPKPLPFTFIILAIFAALWIVTAGITTFRGPFVMTGNGYFASWGAAICAVMAAKDSETASQSSADADENA